jgi:hypothetical protein
MYGNLDDALNAARRLLGLPEVPPAAMRGAEVAREGRGVV